MEKAVAARTPLDRRGFLWAARCKEQLNQLGELKLKGRSPGTGAGPHDFEVRLTCGGEVVATQQVHVDVVVSCVPSIAAEPADVTLCEGGSALLDASGMTLSGCPSAEYEWRDGGGAVVGTTPAVSVSPPATTTYTVQSLTNGTTYFFVVKAYTAGGVLSAASLAFVVFLVFAALPLIVFAQSGGVSISIGGGGRDSAARPVTVE